METYSCMTTVFIAYVLSEESVSQPLVVVAEMLAFVEKRCLRDPQKQTHVRKQILLIVLTKFGNL